MKIINTIIAIQKIRVRYGTSKYFVQKTRRPRNHGEKELRRQRIRNDVERRKAVGTTYICEYVLKKSVLTSEANRKVGVTRVRVAQPQCFSVINTMSYISELIVGSQ